MRTEEAIKLFGLNNLLIEADIARIERAFELDLGHRQKANPSPDPKYYPQFSEKLRREAEQMAEHYVVFYCLENSLRELVTKRLEEADLSGWWENLVPEVVRVAAKKNRDKEISSGVTPRSADLIDFTTFGELGEVIRSNWSIFGDTFRDMKALEKVLASLNTLRGPIAHSKLLAPDEVLRLELSLKDWFRQME